MTNKDNVRNEPERRIVATGVEGLDTVLKGGFLAGGIYIIQGEPGTGKTILGNQICFNHAALGGKALYITLLAEDHGRMLLHLGSLRFFDSSLIPESVYYISAFNELENHGLPGLVKLLRKEAVARGAQILILDGLISTETAAISDVELKKFIHELQLQATMLGCSMFLLTSIRTPRLSAEHTMVDGVVELTQRLYGWRTERDLRVLKRRGADFIDGLHAYRITEVGLTVHPRIEALPLEPVLANSAAAAISTGLSELDAMMGGGLPACSTTLLIGVPGIGKTTLGLQFLSQCDPQERGLFYGFYETPAALRAKAGALQLGAADLIDSGNIEVLWSPATEGSIDDVCTRMLDAVRNGAVRRLFIDGLGALQKLATDSTRISHILAALVTQLRRMGVTAVYTVEVDSFVSGGGPLAGVSMRGASNVAENVLAMRFVEVGAGVHRMIAVVKVRDARIDSRIRLFHIGEQGLRIDESSDRAEKVISRTGRRKRRSRSARSNPDGSPDSSGD